MSTPASATDELAPRIATMIRARLLSTALDTAMAIALVRLLPKAEFAVLGVAFVTYELAKQLAVGGFADSLLVLLPTARPGARRGLALRTARLLLATGALAATVTLLLALTVELWLPQWEPGDRALLRPVLYAFSVTCLLELPSLPLTQLLLSLDQQRGAGLWEIVTSIATLLALLGPILLGYGVLGGAIGVACWSLLRVVAALVIALRMLPLATEAPPPGSLREQLEFAIPLGLHTLVNRLNKHADKLIVTVMMPATALAEYGAASNELPFVTLFPYVVGSVLASRYALAFNSGQPLEAARLWQAGIRKVALAVLPVAVWAIALAPELVLLAFGSGYRGAVSPFRILCALLLLRVAQYGAVLQAARDTRSILRFSAITALANVVLGVALTPVLGLVGTASATLAATVLGVACYARRIGVHFGTGWRGVLPLGYWSRILTASSLSAGATFAARALLPELAPALVLALLSALFVACLAPLLRLFGLWGSSETRALRLVLGLRS